MGQHPTDAYHLSMDLYLLEKSHCNRHSHRGRMETKKRVLSYHSMIYNNLGYGALVNVVNLPSSVL